MPFSLGEDGDDEVLFEVDLGNAVQKPFWSEDARVNVMKASLASLLVGAGIIGNTRRLSPEIMTQFLETFLEWRIP